MHPITPSSAEDLARSLKESAAQALTISVVGNNTKRLMGGPALPSDIVICTSGLRKVLQYEPNDLTISVEAGMPFCELQELLARNRQMIALDPPFSMRATVGGIVSANSSGPMRRGFGTARDLVIGMQFALLDGRSVRSGGMVVKNVAGLDMGKLMIGSFGTLAVMTSINFRLHALPEATHTFLFFFNHLNAAIHKRNAILCSPLRPMALDLISPPAAARMGRTGYVLCIRAGGSASVLRRYATELLGSEQLTGNEEANWWAWIREFSSDFLRRQPNGVVLRISTTLDDIGVLFKLVSGAAVSRAGSGVTYVYLTSWQAVPALWQAALEHGWSAIAEFGPEEGRNGMDRWPLRSSAASENAFAIMKKTKQMFDPHNLLNRNRLYGRL